MRRGRRTQLYVGAWRNGMFHGQGAYHHPGDANDEGGGDCCSGTAGTGGELSLNGQAGGGLSFDGGCQLCTTQQISIGSDASGGLPLDSGRQPGASQPITGISLDSDRHLSTTQPIRSGGGDGDEVTRGTSPDNRCWAGRLGVVMAGQWKDGLPNGAFSVTMSPHALEGKILNLNP